MINKEQHSHYSLLLDVLEYQSAESITTIVNNELVNLTTKYDNSSIDVKTFIAQLRNVQDLIKENDRLKINHNHNKQNAFKKIVQSVTDAAIMFTKSDYFRDETERIIKHAKFLLSINIHRFETYHPMSLPWDYMDELEKVLFALTALNYPVIPILHLRDKLQANIDKYIEINPQIIDLLKQAMGFVEAKEKVA
jgi:hypothetical protein